MNKPQNMGVTGVNRIPQKIFNAQNTDEGIVKLEQWFKKIGAPITLEEAGIPKESVPDLAKNAHGLATRWGMDTRYSKQTIEDILKKAL